MFFLLESLKQCQTSYTVLYTKSETASTTKTTSNILPSIHCMNVGLPSKTPKVCNCSRSSCFRVTCCENMWRACVRACMWVLNSACVCDSKYSNKQMKAVRDCIHVDRWWDFSHTHSHSECKQQNLNLKLDGKSEFTEMIQIRSTIDMKRSQVKVFLYLWFIGILYANLLLFITNFNKS